MGERGRATAGWCRIERGEEVCVGTARARRSRSAAALGMTERVLGMTRRVFGVALLLGAVTLLSPTRPLAAQVGHRPESSPYRDIPKGHTVTPIFGQFGGGGGRFEIAPHDGQVYGLRYDIRTGSPVQFGLGVAHGTLKRLIVDPFVELANRVSGPVDQSVTFAEANLQLNLTGGKTWHRLAPFVGSGVGPHLPERHAGGHQRVRARARRSTSRPTPASASSSPTGSRSGARRGRVFSKLKYPPTFEREPPLEPGDPPDNSNAVITDGRISEWSTSSWLLVGLGYSFSL